MTMTSVTKWTKFQLSKFDASNKIIFFQVFSNKTVGMYL